MNNNVLTYRIYVLKDDAYKPSEIVADFVHHSIEHDYDIAAGRFHLCLMKAARKEESVQRRQRMHDLKKSVPTCSYK
ncbi:hypothetical protein Y032_0015g2659 [Ancylostoma ceylanicum]|uniref:Uncharacterized protein n=1 Tax=Ancylostoma ceylanicum TaxID=53326 RepID=A0A016V865_9BILA|nr:hypothetical protein Y032_0015g2659 [Ancylostoma ceylanicum]